MCAGEKVAYSGSGTKSTGVMSCRVYEGFLPDETLDRHLNISIKYVSTVNLFIAHRIFKSIAGLVISQIKISNTKICNMIIQRKGERPC